MNEEKCIPIDYVCDGIPDCVAGTEEVNCTSGEANCVFNMLRTTSCQ